VPEENSYLCPEGKLLKYVGINKRNRTHVYYSTVKRCRDCSQSSRISTCSVISGAHRKGPDCLDWKSLRLIVGAMPTEELATAYNEEVARIKSEKKSYFWSDPFTYIVIIPACALLLYGLFRLLVK